MLKLIVDSLDAVDEPFRALYEADGDKFKLKVEGVEDTTGLKSALAAERKRADSEAKDKKRWASLGKTPEEIQELLEAQEQRALTEAEKKGEWDKLRAQMNDKHQADLKAKDDQISSMRRTLEKHLVDAQATAAIASEKGVPDLLLPHVQRNVKVVEENGEYLVRIVDSKGDPRVNGKGEPLTISDLVTEMKSNEIYGRAFEGSGQSGSGMQPNKGGGGTPSNKRRSDFKTEKERSAFVNEHGLEAYQALPL